MVCNKCGEKFDENAKFCSNCGTEIKKQTEQSEETKSTEKINLKQRIKKLISEHKIITCLIITFIISLIINQINRTPFFAFLMLASGAILIFYFIFFISEVIPTNSKEDIDRQIEVNRTMRAMKNNPDFQQMMNDFNKKK